MRGTKRPELVDVRSSRALALGDVVLMPTFDCARAIIAVDIRHKLTIATDIVGLKGISDHYPSSIGCAVHQGHGAFPRCDDVRSCLCFDPISGRSGVAFIQDRHIV